MGGLFIGNFLMMKNKLKVSCLYLVIMSMVVTMFLSGWEFFVIWSLIYVFGTQYMSVFSESIRNNWGSLERMMPLPPSVIMLTKYAFAILLIIVGTILAVAYVWFFAYEGSRESLINLTLLYFGGWLIYTGIHFNISMITRTLANKVAKFILWMLAIIVPFIVLAGVTVAYGVADTFGEFFATGLLFSGDFLERRFLTTYVIAAGGLFIASCFVSIWTYKKVMV